MFKLNLLPPQEKKQLEIAKLSCLVSWLAVWLAVFLIVFTLFLLSTSFSLSILLENQNKLIEVREQEEKIQRLVAIEEKIKQTNQRVNQIYLKQKELILWVPILEELSAITPHNIYLTNFSYQASTGQINLSGWANHRDNLLLFQDSLEASSCFTEIEAPLTNLIKQTDINFSFTLHLNSNKN